MDLNYLRQCYQGKRVFITGHSGFKGTWLTKILVKVGANVTGFSLDEYNFPDEEKKGILQSVLGDIRDPSLIKAAVSKASPDIIFHLAAQPLVYKSYDNPSETFETNVQGSLNLLDVVRSHSQIQALVYVTSDKCYEKNEWVWGYREDDRLGGKDPYSASKACAEILFNSYQESYFSRSSETLCSSVRAGNVIGGGDWSENRIVPDAMQALFNNETLYLRNPLATRPWQHVLEPLSGYLLLGSKLLKGDVNAVGSWNFGPSNEEVRSVEEVARAIYGCVQKGRVEINISSGQLHEAGLLKLNCDKASSLLGWSPRWKFDTMIEKTVEWYECFYTSKSISQIYQNQISGYFDDEDY